MREPSRQAKAPAHDQRPRCTQLDLPPELLLLVLGYAKQDDLWQKCALVSKAWHKAATTLTTSIDIRPSTPAKLGSLHKWLRSHGTALRTLQVHATAGMRPVLPQRLPATLPNLQHLELSNLSVHFTAGHVSSSSSDCCTSTPQHSSLCGCAPAAGVLAGLSALTSMRLQDCTISLKGLSACSNLQELCLEQLQEPRPAQQTLKSSADSASPLAATTAGAAISDAEAAGTDPPTTTAAVAAATTSDAACSSSILGQELQGLVSLTRLTLKGSCWDEDTLATLSSCSNLQLLQLSGCAEAILYEGLSTPHSLQQLEVKLAPFDCFDQPTAPSLSTLTSLQSLKLLGLASAQVSPEVVSTLVQLTALQMCHMPLALSDGPCELPALSALMNLQELSLGGLVWPNESDSFTAGDLAALTASSFLTQLDLSEWQVPLSARRGLFPVGRIRMLTGLVQLALGPCWLHSAAAVQQLVKACPNVVSLKVAAITEDSDGWASSYEADTHRSVCLEGLSQLQQLTSLTFIGTTLSKPTAWQQLGQLTGLQRLTCRLAAFEVDSLPELLHLTGCQQLRAVDMTLPCAGQHIRITCHQRSTNSVATSSANPNVCLQLPQVAVQKAAWCCAQLAYANTAHSSSAAAAAAPGSVNSKAALQELLPHALQLCVGAKAYYSSQLQQAYCHFHPLSAQIEQVGLLTVAAGCRECCLRIADGSDNSSSAATGPLVLQLAAVQQKLTMLLKPQQQMASQPADVFAAADTPAGTQLTQSGSMLGEGVACCGELLPALYALLERAELLLQQQGIVEEKSAWLQQQLVTDLAQQPAAAAAAAAAAAVAPAAPAPAAVLAVAAGAVAAAMMAAIAATTGVGEAPVPLPSTPALQAPTPPTVAAVAAATQPAAMEATQAAPEAATAQAGAATMAVPPPAAATTATASPVPVAAAAEAAAPASFTDYGPSFAQLRAVLPHSEGLDCCWAIAKQVHGAASNPAAMKVAPILRTYADVATLQDCRECFQTAAPALRQQIIDRLAALQQLLSEPVVGQPGPYRIVGAAEMCENIAAALEECKAVWAAPSAAAAADPAATAAQAGSPAGVGEAATDAAGAAADISEAADGAVLAGTAMAAAHRAVTAADTTATAGMVEHANPGTDASMAGQPINPSSMLAGTLAAVDERLLGDLLDFCKDDLEIDLPAVLFGPVVPGPGQQSAEEAAEATASASGTTGAGQEEAGEWGWLSDLD